MGALQTMSALVWKQLLELCPLGTTGAAVAPRQTDVFTGTCDSLVTPGL